MASFHEYKRRALLPAVGLGLAGYFLFVFMPLSRRAQNLEEPVRKSWNKLAATLNESNSLSLDFALITNQLAETREALARVSEAKRAAATRLDLTPELRDRMSASFQLFEYQNELSKALDDLDRRARKQQVAVDPTVFAGFPEHTVDVPQPALLWAALAFTRDLLDTALRCKPSAIHSLEVPLPRTGSAGPGAAGRWAEIPLQIEITAKAADAINLCHSLPLRAEELKHAGLPEAPAGKAPLLIDRFVIRKQTPEKPDEVRVWMRVIGFVPP